MRPKKIIFYASGDEKEVSLMRFFLETNGYRFLSASSGREAIATFSSAHPDLALIDQVLPDMQGERLVEILKQNSPHTPMAIIASGYPHLISLFADGTFRKDCPHAEFLERIKVMSARKRGPRKGTQSPHKGIPRDQWVTA